MNNLFFGGSSNIALKLSNKLKNTDAISTKKVVNSYRKFFKIENYTSTNLNKLEKRFDRKYENILIFNGLYSSSFLSIFDNKTFMRDFEINFLIPMKISNFILQKNLLKKMEPYILFLQLQHMKILSVMLIIVYQKTL